MPWFPLHLLNAPLSPPEKLIGLLNEIGPVSDCRKSEMDMSFVGKLRQDTLSSSACPNPEFPLRPCYEDISDFFLALEDFHSLNSCSIWHPNYEMSYPWWALNPSECSHNLNVCLKFRLTWISTYLLWKKSGEGEQYLLASGSHLMFFIPKLWRVVGTGRDFKQLLTLGTIWLGWGAVCVVKVNFWGKLTRRDLL